MLYVFFEEVEYELKPFKWELISNLPMRMDLCLKKYWIKYWKVIWWLERSAAFFLSQIYNLSVRYLYYAVFVYCILKDPVDELRSECESKPSAVALAQKLQECNDRVSSRSQTEESCSEEMIDWVHAVDHCVSSKTEHKYMFSYPFTWLIFKAAAEDMFFKKHCKPVTFAFNRQQ